MWNRTAREAVRFAVIMEVFYFHKAKGVALLKGKQDELNWVAKSLFCRFVATRYEFIIERNCVNCIVRM